MERLYGIQYLRAIAALMVVIYHAGLRSEFDFHIGGAGVDVFFVISGVIMWIIGTERPLDPGAFLVRRFARIAPLYWSVTLGVFVIAMAMPELMQEMHTDTGRLLLSLLFIPHMDRAGQPFPVLAAGWSLNYEMFFYLLFALAMMLPRRFWLPAMTAGLTALSSASALQLEGSVILATYTDPMLLEFVAGLWLGWLWQRRLLPSARAGAPMTAAGAALIAAQQLLGIDGLDWRPIAWGIPAVAIVLGVLAIEAEGRMPVVPRLERLGDASYSIYLLHGPMVGLIWRLSGGPPLALYLPLAAMVCSAAGLLCWRLFEQPATRFTRALLGSLRPRRL